MMQHLNKYPLDAELVEYFVQKTLNNGNALCSEVLKAIDFNSGNFFTILPQEIQSTQNICNFDEGFSNQTKNLDNHHEEDIQSTGASIREYLSLFIYSYMQKSEKVSCIFDDVQRRFSDHFRSNAIDKFGVFFQNEVYYLIDDKKCSKESIIECLRASNAFWHSLCILSGIELNKQNNHVLSLQEIEQICKNIRLIILGAYDGEGYIFWEKL